MRMRKKPNLLPRMERCAPVLVREPETLCGRWLGEASACEHVHLELGCGKGSFTVETAARNTDALLVAVEKVPDAMVMAMEKAMERGISNVRFIDCDAQNLPTLFAPGEAERIYINFPDPWPRSHDARRRLTAPNFLRIYADVLPVGGQIHFKTDNDPLFQWSLDQMEAEGWELSELTRDLHAEGVCGVMTDYEQRFHAIGISINRVVATKTAETKTRAAGEVGRLYQAGIERPYRPSAMFAEAAAEAAQAQEDEA